MQKKPSRILIIDNDISSINILIEWLKPNHALNIAKTGQLGLEIANSEATIDLIILAMNLPDLTASYVCGRLKQNPLTESMPVIFLDSEKNTKNEALCYEVGGIDYLYKPLQEIVVLHKIKNQIKYLETKRLLSTTNLVLEHRVDERENEVEKTQDIALMCLASLAETRDNETGNHILRTQNYVEILAQSLRKNEVFFDYLTDTNIELLYKSAPLHDIGKVGVRDEILLKPGKLDEHEWQEMKRHTIYGYQSLLRVEKKIGEAGFLTIAKEIVFSHHEKYDGTGYPQQLKGDQIPLSAQLMALADVYDALVCKRVYKKAFPHKEAVKMILLEKGRQFSPVVVSGFEKVQDDFFQTAIELAD